MTLLSDEAIRDGLSKLEGWTQVDAGNGNGIAKVFSTGNFLKGLAFVTKVAVLAENANHHPDVELTYPRVTMTLTTHEAGGLTERDFKLAGEIDAL